MGLTMYKGMLSVEIWAIVLGANDSILNVGLPYGYEFLHCKLKETQFEKEIILSNNRLDAKYYGSNLGTEEDPEFIFIHKSVNEEFDPEPFTINKVFIENKSEYDLFEKIKKRSNWEVFNIVSMLRLSQEGDIEIATKWFLLEAQYLCTKIKEKNTSILDSAINVYDNGFVWNDDNIATFNLLTHLNSQMVNELQDVYDRFAGGYAASQLFEAYINLVSLGEILVIGCNSGDKNNGKKEKFSNRIAAIVADDTSVNTVKNKLMDIYKERSDAIHEGNDKSISQEKLIELRCYIRTVILSFINYCNNNGLADKSFTDMKTAYVKSIVKKVKDLRDKGYLDA